ncbi:MAG: 50S ribosomal protein L7ae [Oscillospiraceae bacterium]|nr:50S ribosomal protein L7ae [Oscillospiraceae bacterium]
MDKALGLLGIAKKAGFLAIGGEAAAISARHGKARLIISACDASERSVRRAKENSAMQNIKYLPVPYTKFELGSITGRGSPGVIAILDKGLAKGFTDKLTEAGRTLNLTAQAKTKAETKSEIKEGDAL